MRKHRVYIPLVKPNLNKWAWLSRRVLTSSQVNPVSWNGCELGVSITPCYQSPAQGDLQSKLPGAETGERETTRACVCVSLRVQLALASLVPRHS